MNLNKLTEKAQEAVVEAQRLAENRGHTQVEPEHLLAALITQENGVVPAIRTSSACHLHGSANAWTMC